ncbi:hypothetical protein C8Q73DRAFT_212358 [Cubamyces lactineus]|nr:hypothetical protein C8Q73DRAFT_263491 [Cubamyces lactineus]KAH9900663.1 hypothetical protein C8Q73DRAFT_212358 [Cubamyces lactineus]
MGRGGAIAILLVVFMAVTSAVSAELIAVSSLFTYDLYRTYHRPQATNDEIVRVSHYFICFWAVWAGCWSTILHKASIDLGWLFYVQGVVLSPAVIPIALTVSWSKLTRAGVFAGSLAGAVLGMLAWMVGCWKIYGECCLGAVLGMRRTTYDVVTSGGPRPRLQCAGGQGLVLVLVLMRVLVLVSSARSAVSGECH